MEGRSAAGRGASCRVVPHRMGRLSMDDVRSLLERRLAEAFDAVSPGADPVVRPSERADLQANGALALTKVLGRPPVEIARSIVDHLDVSDICDVVEVSGRGFINLTF